MSIASMTGFARTNGSLQTANETISWVWEIKSVNGKSLDVKVKLPLGYDDLSLGLKSKAGDYLTRGSVSASLEIAKESQNKKVKIDEDLLNMLTQKTIELSEKYAGKLALSTAAELLAQRGVVEVEEASLSEEEQELLTKKIAQSFGSVCQKLQSDRQKEGAKIKKALEGILNNIERIVSRIDEIAVALPEKLKEKLRVLMQQYAGEVDVSEDRIAQEIVFLVTRADIREEIDRLKTHLKSAYQMLDSGEAVGRRLDFLCQ